MHRTEGVNHAANLFQNGPPGTRVEKNWLNAVQEEISHVIEDAGITLRTASTETRDQLLTAILALINVSGFFFSTMIKTGDYTVSSADKGKLILADATVADMTLALPDPNVALNGFAIGVKKTDSSGHKVTLDPIGSGSIEGSSNFDLMLQNGTVIAICNGTEYFLISLNEITNAMCAASLKDPAPAVAGLRTLGNGAQQAMPGDKEVAVIKAWVNFNGTGVVAIRDSYNVVSVVDNAVGDYTIYWDTDFANTDYCYWGAGEDWGGQGDVIVGRPEGGAKTIGSMRIKTVDAGLTNADFSEVCVAAIGDQI